MLLQLKRKYFPLIFKGERAMPLKRNTLNPKGKKFSSAYPLLPSVFSLFHANSGIKAAIKDESTHNGPAWCTWACTLLLKHTSILGPAHAHFPHIRDPQNFYCTFISSYTPTQSLYEKTLSASHRCIDTLSPPLYYNGDTTSVHVSANKAFSSCRRTSVILRRHAPKK